MGGANAVPTDAVAAPNRTTSRLLDDALIVFIGCYCWLLFFYCLNEDIEESVVVVVMC